MNDPFLLDDWEVPELPCSLARQLTVMLGALSIAGAAGFAITLFAVRRWVWPK